MCLGKLTEGNEKNAHNMIENKSQQVINEEVILFGHSYASVQQGTVARSANPSNCLLFDLHQKHSAVPRYFKLL